MGGGDQRTTLLHRAPVNQARRWGDCGALCLAGAMPQDKRLQFGVTRVADDMESVTSHAVVSLLSQACCSSSYHRALIVSQKSPSLIVSQKLPASKLRRAGRHIAPRIPPLYNSRMGSRNICV